jgi:probable HAF family extracellular repeat protein
MPGHRLFQRFPVMAAVLLAVPLWGCMEDSTPTELAAAVLFDVQTQVEQIEYEVVILTPDYERSLVRGINRNGVVSGMGHLDVAPEDTSWLQNIFFWAEGEVVTGPEAVAGGIDDDANVVGSMDGQAVFWPTVPEAGFTNEVSLNTTGMGEGRKAAHGINDHGNIVGTGPAQDGDYYSWFWPEHDAPPIRLNPPDGFDGTRWTGRLNNAGYVTSAASVKDGDGRTIQEVAIVWRANDRADGAMEVSPVTLPHLGASFTVAHGINHDGDVVGQSRTDGGQNRAVLWRYDGNGWGDPIPLSGDRAEAYDLTDRVDGVVRIVGRASSSRGSEATLWTVDGSNNVQMKFLPLPEGFHRHSSLWAWVINEAGWIAGWAQDRDAYQLAVLWRPVATADPPPDEDDDNDDDDGDNGTGPPCHHNPNHPCHRNHSG